VHVYAASLRKVLGNPISSHRSSLDVFFEFRRTKSIVFILDLFPNTTLTDDGCRDWDNRQ
jgi:hypothetical protein